MKIVDKTRRVCGLCKVDQTPLGKGLSEQRNSRGHGIGLFCDECCPIVRKKVDTIASLHGAYIVDGRYMSSPRGTPDLTSIEAIDAYILAASQQ